MKKLMGLFLTILATGMAANATAVPHFYADGTKLFEAYQTPELFDAMGALAHAQNLEKVQAWQALDLKTTRVTVLKTSQSDLTSAITYTFFTTSSRATIADRIFDRSPRLVLKEIKSCPQANEELACDAKYSAEIQ